MNLSAAMIDLRFQKVVIVSSSFVLLLLDVSHRWDKMCVLTEEVTGEERIKEFTYCIHWVDVNIHDSAL